MQQNKTRLWQLKVCLLLWNSSAISQQSWNSDLWQYHLALKPHGEQKMLCCRNINAFLYWHDCSVMYSLLAELEQDVLLTPAFQACFFCLQNFFRHGHCNLMGTSWGCEFTWHLTVKCWINCLIIIGQILQFSQNWHKHRIMKQWLTRWIVSNKCTAVLIIFLKLKLKLNWYWNYVRKTLQKLELKWFEKQCKQEL